MVESVITTSDDVRVVEVTGETVRPGRRYPRRRGDRTFRKQLSLDQALPLRHSVDRGGDWVPRDLGTASLKVTVREGAGVIDGQPVAWPETTVTTPLKDSLVVVEANGTVKAVEATTEKLALLGNRLVLYRTLYTPTRIAAVIDRRTFTTLPAAPALNLERLVRDAVAKDTPWADAVAVTKSGPINWYFANLGLYPFVTALPDVVARHLNVQVRTFYADNATGQKDWSTVHRGSTWSDYVNWPYDLLAGSGSARAKWRADSHDAYAATFCWLAVRYARQVKVNGPAWWTANVKAVQNALLHNIIRRRRQLTTTGECLSETFQDPSIYRACQALDNIEVYRGLTDALALMRESDDSAQQAFAETHAAVPGEILKGIQRLWLSAASRDTLSPGWDTAAMKVMDNPLERFYPDFTIGLPAALFDVPLSANPTEAARRVQRLRVLIDTMCPDWWRSRRYDHFPSGMVAAAAVKLGARDVGAQWLDFVRTHVAKDSPGYFQINEIGWAKYIQQRLQGQDPGF